VNSQKTLKKGDIVQIGGIAKRTINYGRKGDIRKIYPDGKARIRVGPRKCAIVRLENLVFLRSV
jgi:hypothetical protein